MELMCRPGVFPEWPDVSRGIIVPNLQCFQGILCSTRIQIDTSSLPETIIHVIAGVLTGCTPWCGTSYHFNSICQQS